MAKRTKYICNYLIFCTKREHDGMVLEPRCLHAKPHPNSKKRRMVTMKDGMTIWTNPKSNCSHKHYHERCYYASDLEGRQCVKIGE